jgi:hypothetical protein
MQHGVRMPPPVPVADLWLMRQIDRLPRGVHADQVTFEHNSMLPLRLAA